MSKQYPPLNFKLKPSGDSPVLVSEKSRYTFGVVRKLKHDQFWNFETMKKIAPILCLETVLRVYFSHFKEYHDGHLYAMILCEEVFPDRLGPWGKLQVKFVAQLEQDLILDLDSLL